MPVRICSCTAAKCPVAQPLPGQCARAVLPPHCLPEEHSCNIWELHTSSMLGGNCWREQGKDTCICHSETIYHNIPMWLQSTISVCFFFSNCWKHSYSSYKREWSLFSSCENPLTHVRDKFVPQDSKESRQSILACKESLLFLKSILRQNVFSSTHCANSIGWYWVGSRTISLQLLPFTFFQLPSYLTLWELPVMCCLALTSHGIEEDNLLTFPPMLEPALVSCLNNARLKLTTRL